MFLRITLACLFCHYVGATLVTAGAGHAAKALHTQLVVDTQNVFLTYQHNGAEAADVTFNLKDFKHMLALCEGMGANVAVRFDSPGAPLLVEPSLHGTHAQVLQANVLGLPTPICMYAGPVCFHAFVRGLIMTYCCLKRQLQRRTAGQHPA